jgi:GntR family transcriptional regulator
VSRHTLRQAIDQLVREGLLVRHRGRGTVVARVRFLEQPLGGIYSFARDMAQRGLAQHSEILTQELREATADERSLFELAPSERVFRLIRLRFLEDAPLILEVLHMPQYPGQALYQADLREASVYELLESEAGVVITRAHEVIRAVVLQPEDAVLLGSPGGAPALSVERFGYAGRRLVEWRDSLIRADRFAFRVELPHLITADERAGRLIYRPPAEGPTDRPSDDDALPLFLLP